MPLPSPLVIGWPALPALETTTTPATTLNPDAWRERYAAAYCSVPDAPRHAAVWSWLAGLAPGERSRPLVAVWPRGGGKSTTVELGAAYVGHRQTRRYVLYVCETQAQADRHVGAVAAILEKIGIPRSVNVYGHSKGWKRQEIRAANGFSVSAFGLDTGARGVKMDEVRPDLLIFDDIDGRHDSPTVTRRKVEILTETVIPAGSTDAAVLFVQNLIHADSIAAQLADGRAAFLADRLPVAVTPAVDDLRTESAIVDGQIQTRITGGVPTWAGQDLAACQRIINDIALPAFLRECQHEVARPEGIIYRVFDEGVHTYEDRPIPAEWARYVGLDFGGTHTCAVFLAEEPDTGHLWMYAEYLAGDLTTAQHTQAILDRCAGVIPFCSGGATSEGQWRREFRAAGLAVAEPGVALVDVGIDRVRSVLSLNGISIARSCQGTLGQLRTYANELDAAGRPTGRIVNKHAYHYLDALRYILVRIRRGGAA